MGIQLVNEYKNLYNEQGDKMDGIIVVNKPIGMTSHDVINKMRKIFKQKKFGHSGTLDPQASGVLVVLCGKACKILQFLQDTDKVYRSSIQLGYTTDTDDIFGNTMNTKDIHSDFDFEQVLKSFEGKNHQMVPMTSAKKINGKKLLEYQRDGIDIQPVYTDIEIYEMKAIDASNLSFEISCSSGTYVRSVCRDFGLKTSNLACMKSLERIQVGRFTIDMAQSLEDLQENGPVLYPMEMLLDHIPKIHYEDIQAIYQGKHVRIDSEFDRVCIVDGQRAIAIYDRDHKNVFKSVRGLW